MYGQILNASDYYNEPIWPEYVDYTFKVCEVDSKQYLISDMVRDKDNGCWILKDNVEEYLSNCKSEMFLDDYIVLEEKLNKQI